MATNRVKVVINGNVLSLQGEASEEHMQKVAKVINEKLAEIHETYNKAHLTVGRQDQLLILNLADEYVKKQEELEDYSTALQQAEAEQNALKKKLADLTVESAQIKQELAARMHHRKKHTNRGR